MPEPRPSRSARRRRRLLNVVALYLTLCVAPMAVAGKQYDGGVWPFLASCCIGPRVGLQMNEGVAVRDYEQFSWLPIVGWFGYRFYMAWEAYDGKTFSEVAREENLLPPGEAAAAQPGSPAENTAAPSPPPAH
jgi:hypothetical protein